MKNLVILMTLLIASVFNQTANASAVEIKECKDADIDLTSLVYPVVSKSAFDERVKIYKVDTIEPDTAAIGLAIVMPVTPNDEIFITKCFSITGFGGIGLDKAKKHYDSANSVTTMSMPVKQYDVEKGYSVPAGELQLKIILNDTESGISAEFLPLKSKASK